METIQEVMDFIGSRYIFNEENYPNMKGMDTGQQAMFALNHSVLLMQKSVGKLAEVCESYDHSGKVNEAGRAQVEEVTVKMLVSTLKLAQELGLNGKELAERVPQFMKSK